ncbi:hypothetical protein BaRGS_00019608 [Batillaria attramentaria]|uniref:Uncharacterized protein n=1 Tax=Batillaria attramentaria TaxID=370345 RepID=A0ABD0KPQ3_9CAEN
MAQSRLSLNTEKMVSHSGRSATVSKWQSLLSLYAFRKLSHTKTQKELSPYHMAKSNLVLCIQEKATHKKKAERAVTDTNGTVFASPSQHPGEGYTLNKEK